MRIVNRNETKCILDDGTNQWLCDSEKDTLVYITKIKEILISNKKNNMIFCLEGLNPAKKGKGKYKIYMLVNEQYDTKEEVIEAIRDWRKKGFVAYPIL